MLRGELDMATEAEAREAIATGEGSPARAIVIDARQLTFVGSSGVRLLVATADRLGADGRELALLPGRATEQVLALTGLADRFTYRSDGRLPAP